MLLFVAVVAGMVVVGGLIGRWSVVSFFLPRTTGTTVAEADILSSLVELCSALPSSYPVPTIVYTRV